MIRLISDCTRHIPIFLFLLVIAELPLSAQAPVDYNDVVVVINDNSEDSREIGSYFAQARSVPERNLIHISVPEKETINDSEFEDLRGQIEEYLTRNAMEDTISYIVLTKGVPLRVNRPVDSTETAQTTRRASVDNELVLILEDFADLIGGQGWAYQNYSTYTSHFSRSLLPVYLVTRLDAYTKEDVFRMIDNSGPNTLVNKDSVVFVMDRDPTPIDKAFDSSQVLAWQVLASRQWKVVLNSDSVYITDQKNVLGYTSWGSNDNFSGLTSEHAIPRNTWSPGSLAETFVSTSGRSFKPETNYGQSLIADILAEGATGAKGYVFEPFTIALAFPHTLFYRYTDETQDTTYNLAESFFAASRTVSWMEVVIGDPKTSIMSRTPDLPNPRISPSYSICIGDRVDLQPFSTERGAHNWFRGDSASIAEYGLPYDDRHPAWITGGKQLSPPTDESGAYDYTYVNTNVTGSGFAQVRVIVAEQIEPDFELPADTVRLGEEVTFTDLTEGTNVSRRWEFGDGGILIVDEEVPASRVTHTYTREGTYTVRLLLYNDGCPTSVTKKIVVTTTTSVRDRGVKPTFGLLIQPNPTADDVRITADFMNAERVVIRLFDPQGRLMLTERVPSTVSLRHQLSLKAYPAGAYLIEITAGDEQVRDFVLRR